MCVDRVTRVDVVVTRALGRLVVGWEEEGEDGGRGEEVFHEDRGQLDEVGCTARA